MQTNIPTLLVVEDEQSLLKVLAEKFRKEGLNVLTASNGASALTLAEEYHPDLLVVDLVMSNSDGLNLISQVRKTGWGKNIPVMFLSSWVGAVKTAEECDVKEDHFHDIWNFEQVMEKVKKRLSNFKSRNLLIN